MNRRHMRDASPATPEEQQEFANRWGYDANQYVGRKVAQHGNDELRWGDSKLLTFDFTANGTEFRDVEQLILVNSKLAKVWSLHFALTMVSPIQMAGGDNVGCFYLITTGLGSSTIRFRKFLDNTNFVPVPVPGGLVQDVADLVVPDVPANQIIVGARVQYANTHGAVTVQLRVDAAAAPVVR